MPLIEVLDIAARGGAAAIILLLAGTLVRLGSSSPSARMGVLFALGSAAYTLISSPVLFDALAPVRPVLRPLATYNAVFFWWFATALLNDGFTWRMWRLAPAAAIAAVTLARGTTPIGSTPLGEILMQAIVLGLMLDALALAVRGLGNDLVEPRRRFRLALVGLTGIMGLAIAIAEIAQLYGPIPRGLILVHALALLGLAFGFALWALAARSELFEPRRSCETAPGADKGVEPEDRALLARLQAAMDEGVYTEPGLTVPGLAARLGTQEHRLRKVINQGLGYRNFTAFLNARRLADARTILADPAQARRQVLQVALDLGYGSIGPFNRAFKQTIGVTPSEYRKAALAGQVNASA